MTLHYVAFYEGKGKLLNAIIRAVTRSRYSHCELVRADWPPREGETLTCLSASAWDGGIREKEITFDPGKWTFVPVPWAPSDAWDRAVEKRPAPYDYPGLVLSHFLNLRIHARRRWFCSELCAHAVGLRRPARFAPGDLYEELIERNDAMGRVTGRPARTGWM